ncbi:uncharacterized protein B0I36DRAFT_329665 [Microdochium trichocladiopsis]|uniref:Uncharacterized protein n=1 Tax=Microdochium trichocladiopsis TaxID=1682393 RepID=A0A9P8Y008_9PEZI|nr:uncharacterized protein B0I36DRAFT_329665 [Microdochium trichocladiopsis]KAH7026001.1 hypothetical protein B0I36DRAFT_329665 [Microdochium trichocladiopsis]
MFSAPWRSRDAVRQKREVRICGQIRRDRGGAAILVQISCRRSHVRFVQRHLRIEQFRIGQT